MIRALLKIEALKLLRNGSQIWQSAIFFILFLSLCGLTLQAQADVPERVSVALIWVGLLFSILFGSNQLFSDDIQDGTLAQYVVSGVPIIWVVITKIICLWLINSTILSFIVLGFTAISDFEFETTLRVILTIIVGALGLSAYAGFTSSCFSALNNSGLALIILATPLCIPFVLLGISALDATSGDAALQILAGVSFIAISLAIPATTLVCRSNMEA